MHLGSEGDAFKVPLAQPFHHAGCDKRKKYPGTSVEARAWLREQGYEVIEEDNKKKLLAQNITSGLSPFRK